MKQLKLTMALLAAGLMMVSCNKDDDGGSEGTLEGKWIYSKSGGMASGHEVLTDWDHTEGCNKDYVEFVEGGVYNDVYYWEDCEEDKWETTWTREGNTITVGTGEAAETGEIINLTGSELKLKSTYEEGGVNVDYITVFTRG